MFLLKCLTGGSATRDADASQKRESPSSKAYQQAAGASTTTVQARADSSTAHVRRPAGSVTASSVQAQEPALPVSHSANQPSNLPKRPSVPGQKSPAGPATKGGSRHQIAQPPRRKAPEDVPQAAEGNQTRLRRSFSLPSMHSEPRHEHRFAPEMPAQVATPAHKACMSQASGKSSCNARMHAVSTSSAHQNLQGTAEAVLKLAPKSQAAKLHAIRSMLEQKQQPGNVAHPRYPLVQYHNGAAADSVSQSDLPPWQRASDYKEAGQYPLSFGLRVLRDTSRKSVCRVSEDALISIRTAPAKPGLKGQRSLQGHAVPPLHTPLPSSGLSPGGATAAATYPRTTVKPLSTMVDGGSTDVERVLNQLATGKDTDASPCTTARSSHTTSTEVDSGSSDRQGRYLAHSLFAPSCVDIVRNIPGTLQSPVLGHAMAQAAPLTISYRCKDVSLGQLIDSSAMWSYESNADLLYSYRSFCSE